MKIRSLAFLLALAFPLAASACEVVVSKAWAKATAPGQPAAGAYFDIASGHSAKVVAVQSPAAAMVELHETKMEAGVMKMRQLDGLDLPAGKTVSLKPGGTHVMLMQLKAPLKAGAKLPLQLTVEQGGKRHMVNVEADIRAMGAEQALR
ncbi:copper chaperone PCu(A)C [Chitinimonas arctica]|uniref:Copper chaperone PCu(A)C n=1 Tax=Chitinimonas arctica TaxID=2594795 RepID=A0A516SFU5_9NEIS|nr:copper chaperone PCu(A)C [Chitinimonas arctica]QDQ26898.1 copper chaperone PCu(A)C [Chitinimonas arctica]